MCVPGDLWQSAAVIANAKKKIVRRLSPTNTYVIATNQQQRAKERGKKKVCNPAQEKSINIGEVNAAPAPVRKWVSRCTHHHIFSSSSSTHIHIHTLSLQVKRVNVHKKSWYKLLCCLQQKSQEKILFEYIARKAFFCEQLVIVVAWETESWSWVIMVYPYSVPWSHHFNSLQITWRGKGFSLVVSPTRLCVCVDMCSKLYMPFYFGGKRELPQEDWTEPSRGITAS